MNHASPVAGDRAEDQPGIDGGEPGEIEPAIVDRHVDAGRQATDVGIVDDNTALATVPHGAAPDRTVVAAFNLDDVGAVVRQQHPRHRPRDARGQLQHGYAIEHAGHRAAVASSMAAMMTAGESGCALTRAPRWATASATALMTRGRRADGAALAHALVAAGVGRRRRLDVAVLDGRAPRPRWAGGSRGTSCVSGLPSSS